LSFKAEDAFCQSQEVQRYLHFCLEQGICGSIYWGIWSALTLWNDEEDKYPAKSEKRQNKQCKQQGITTTSCAQTALSTPNIVMLTFWHQTICHGFHVPALCKCLTQSKLLI